MRSTRAARWMIALALCLLIPLAACGGGDDDDNDTTADGPDGFGDGGDSWNGAPGGGDAWGDDDIEPPEPEDDVFVAEWPQVNVEDIAYDESAAPGPARLKANAYDEFHLDWHQPYFGGTVGVTVFTDDNRTAVSSYGDYGDSCIWTGTYIVSQAMRYYVTGDAQAKQNVTRSVESQDHRLHITGRPGFIARYAAPQDPLIYHGDAWCDDDRDNCHHIEDGNTSRDQYTGWFFGMATAWDLVFQGKDDADMRGMIASDVTEVLDELLATDWWIIDVDGEATTAAPNVLPTQQLAWALIGYHITGHERYKEVVQKWIADDKRRSLRLMNLTFMNRYAQYYGNNLGHQNMYTLLRLAKVYLSESDYRYIGELFDEQTHSFTRLSHNAFFNAIFMSQGAYDPSMEPDPYQEQLEQDLSEFRDAPNWSYFVDPPDGELDPLSVTLADLMDQYPFLGDIFGDVDPQSKYAHPVRQQCSTDFLWQRNPFRIEPCGSDRPNVTRPGVDYLVAYWMASYHGFVDKTF